MQFVIIGAQKSASTSLQQAVAAHPEVWMPHGESALFESTYYSPDLVKRSEVQWRRAAAGRRIGIKRPDYLSRAEVPGNIERHYPDARFVAVLRNPADRALSAYYHYMRYGFIPVKDHESGLSDLLDRAGAPGGVQGRAHEILDYGLYSPALTAWKRNVGSERLLICLQHDLLRSTAAELSRIYTHIGVSPDGPDSLPSAMEGAFHPLRLKIWSAAHPVIYSTVSNERLVERNWLVSRAYGFLDRRVAAKVLRAPRPALSADLRARILDFYADDIDSLERDHGLRVAQWRQDSLAATARQEP